MCLMSFSQDNVKKKTIRKHERKKTNLAAVRIIQVKVNGGLDQDGSGRNGKRWRDSGSILKMHLVDWM